MKNKWAVKVGFLAVTSLVIPALFFVVVELTLRATGYGYETDFFVRQKIQGEEYYVNNYKFSWQFFPKPMARLSASVKVPAVKDQSALRVFVFGESAAMGDPEPSFSFSRQLEVMVREKYPSKKIEIYNTAVTAINSNVILPIVRDCLKLQPDLIVLYSGNNEVIGPYGLSAALSPFFSSRLLIKFQIQLGKSRLGQWFRDLTSKEEIDEEEWKGMGLFMKNQVSYDNADLEIIYSHFKENIEEICQLAAKSGARVVLSTVITNERDCAPFVSMHKAGITLPEVGEWKRRYLKAIALDTAGNVSQALIWYKRALAIDSTYAELNFRIAKCYARLNYPDYAAKHFVSARDEDGLRFRCDSRMNDILREIGRNNSSKNVFFADTESFARARSADNVLGKELLYEHVHLNFAGNNFLAKTVLGEAELALGLHTPLGQDETPGTCKARLAYTTYDKKRINDLNLARIQMPPFTNQCTNVADVATMRINAMLLEENLDSLVIIGINKTYEDVLSSSPKDWFVHLNYLRFLFGYNRFAKAADEAKHLYDLLPYEYLSDINMGVTQKALHHYKESYFYFARAIELNPHFSEAYKAMALLYEEAGEFYKAEPFLSKARFSMKEFGATYNRVGIKFAKQNNADSAIKYFRKANAMMPGYKPSVMNLQHAIDMKTRQISSPTTEFSEAYNNGNALFRQGNFPDAIQFYKKAITLNPSFSKAYNNLGIALIQVNKIDEAIDNFSAAIRIDPKFIGAYPNLAKSLETTGRFAEAGEALKTALKLKEDPDLYKMLAGIYLKTGNVKGAVFCDNKEREIRARLR